MGRKLGGKNKKRTEIVCVDCQKPIIVKSTKVDRCPLCKKKHSLELAREYRKSHPISPEKRKEYRKTVTPQMRHTYYKNSIMKSARSSRKKVTFEES